MAKLQAVAFDIVETVMSLAPAPARLSERGYPAELFELWFARAVRDGMALGAAGGYRTFHDVSASALRDATGHTVDDATIEHVLGGWDRFPAHPDVEPALRVLTAAGIRVVGLTTGSADTINGFLAHNGLSGYFDAVLSCEDVGAWKPAPAVYHYAADWLGLPPEDVALVAAHAWDCHGAGRAGLRTGWVSRLEGHYSANFDPADATGDNLTDVVEQLLRQNRPG